jgi:hypothetical protein
MTDPNLNDACAQAEELLPAYWVGDLTADDRAWVDHHLQTCPACAEVAALWNDLAALPEVEPDPLERRRFDAMLAACGAGSLPSESQSAPERQVAFGPSWRGVWQFWVQPVHAAAALAILLAAGAGGWLVRGAITPSANPAVVTSPQSAEIAALREEVNDTRQLVVLSMLQQQSANDRLAGISYSNRVSPDPEIVRALVHSLQNDPSPDVRLAALDALQRAGGAQGSSAAARSLVEAFPYQNSPLVQVALVDSFLALRPPGAQQLLEKVRGDRNYSPEVQQHAGWALSRWN